MSTCIPLHAQPPAVPPRRGWASAWPGRRR